MGKLTLLAFAVALSVSGQALPVWHVDPKPMEIKSPPTLVQTKKSKWPLEPDGFKGVKFGDSLAEAQAHSPNLDCPEYGQPAVRENHSCYISIDLPGEALMIAHLFFLGNRMRTVDGTFPSSSFSDIKDIFVAKYGRPLVDVGSEVRTKVGAKYQQESLSWIGEKIAIVVFKYSGTVDEGAFLIQSTEDVEVHLKKDEEAKKTALN